MNSEMGRYWNESGGRRWAANIARVERMLQPLADALLQFAAPQAGERVLNVGCGGGLTSSAFAATVGPGGDVLGLDISAVILDIARARFARVRNLRFAQANGCTRRQRWSALLWKRGRVRLLRIAPGCWNFRLGLEDEQRCRCAGDKRKQ